MNYGSTKTDISIASELSLLKLETKETVQEFITRARDLYAEIGVKRLSEPLFVAMIKLRLNDDFRDVRQDDSITSLSLLTAGMREAEARKKVSIPALSSLTTTISRVQRQQESSTSNRSFSKKNNAKDNNNKTENNKKKFNGHCDFCGYYGHKEADCFRKKNGQVAATSEQKTRLRELQKAKTISRVRIDDEVINNTEFFHSKEDSPSEFEVRRCESRRWGR